MRRIYLQNVPDDVYVVLSNPAAADRQSLSAFVVHRLTEVARVEGLADYLASYAPPTGSGVSLEAATAAVREERDAS